MRGDVSLYLFAVAARNNSNARLVAYPDFLLRPRYGRESDFGFTRIDLPKKNQSAHEIVSRVNYLRTYTLDYYLFSLGNSGGKVYSIEKSH